MPLRLCNGFGIVGNVGNAVKRVAAAKGTHSAATPTNVKSVALLPAGWASATLEIQGDHDYLRNKSMGRASAQKLCEGGFAVALEHYS